MKTGVVCMIGRPNSGKSTLLNAILKQKVSITSPKPQTTRFPIQAVYEDARGQIIFVDTPGIYEKSTDALSKRINASSEDSLSQNVDVVLYVVDHTRERDYEENRALGIVRKSKAPKIMVINKTDIKKPTHIVQYKFMQDEFPTVVEVSALTHANINLLLDEIFALLPEGTPQIDMQTLAQPALNLDSKTFVSEIIREKAFLNLRKELPYEMTVVVDDLAERENGTLAITARILTSNDRYKAMIIGDHGVMIKEIGMAARKELETATNKHVYIDLTVETDPHWMEYLT